MTGVKNVRSPQSTAKTEIKKIKAMIDDECRIRGGMVPPHLNPAMHFTSFNLPGGERKNM